MSIARIASSELQELREYFEGPNGPDSPISKGHPLLSQGATNAKTKKKAQGIYSIILYLAPAKTSGLPKTLCPCATLGCTQACLYTAGHGAKGTVQAARIRKARWYLLDRERFLARLNRELAHHYKKAQSLKMLMAVRLNGTSDIAWEKFDLVTFNRAGVVHYDYTKIESRVAKSSKVGWPLNYTLTLSYNENMPAYRVRNLSKRGVNIAVVTNVPKNNPLPTSLEFAGQSIPVLDGRADDWRWRDTPGHIVGLSALGAAKRDTSGFVVTPA